MRIANDDVSQFLTKMVPYVNADGARNLNKISRELAIPYQTLRFRMMRLKAQGISILPLISAESVGLERIRASFKLSSDVSDLTTFFGGLHQSAGLHYYSRSLISQEFDAEFMIPAGTKPELARLLNALSEMNILDNIVLRRLDWKEILVMKTRLYDYEHGQWDVDFSRLSSDPSLKIPTPNLSEEYDQTDLLIIKSLQIDPWIKVVDLSKKFQITEGDISYHLNRHVFGRGQVPGFRFRWIGTPEAWSKHSVLGVTLVFKEITEESFRRAMAIVTSNPFAWNHMRGEDGTYITEFLIPTSHLPETMQHLSENFRKMELKPEMLFPDWAGSASYTIPYLMHDKQAGWRFSTEQSLAYILQMMKAYESK
ncbi:MAG TPA: hypothetical protein VFF30_14015 [Nitrososphaerales archaeon]|nr:hypothetical protein [Nitrososphaerales archaeon]